MATIVLAIGITVTSAMTATTIPSPTGNRTIATGDKWVTDLAEDVRRIVASQFGGVLSNANVATTITTQTIT